MNNTTRTGILAGFMAIFLITMFYIAQPRLLVEGYTWLKQLIFLGAIIYGLSRMRANSVQAVNLQELAKNTQEIDTSKDFIGFSELLTNGFKIYLIGYFITFLYIYVLFNFIDPSLIDLVRDTTVQINSQMKNPETANHIFEAQLKELSERDFAPRLTDIISVIGMIEIIIGFIMSFVVALFLRREQPNY